MSWFTNILKRIRGGDEPPAGAPAPESEPGPGGAPSVGPAIPERFLVSAPALGDGPREHWPEVDVGALPGVRFLPELNPQTIKAQVEALGRQITDAQAEEAARRLAVLQGQRMAAGAATETALPPTNLTDPLSQGRPDITGAGNIAVTHGPEGTVIRDEPEEQRRTRFADYTETAESVEDETYCLSFHYCGQSVEFAPADITGADQETRTFSIADGTGALAGKLLAAGTCFVTGSNAGVYTVVSAMWDTAETTHVVVEEAIPVGAAGGTMGSATVFDLGDVPDADCCRFSILAQARQCTDSEGGEDGEHPKFHDVWSPFTTALGFYGPLYYQWVFEDSWPWTELVPYYQYRFLNTTGEGVAEPSLRVDCKLSDGTMSFRVRRISEAVPDDFACVGVVIIQVVRFGPMPPALEIGENCCHETEEPPAEWGDGQWSGNPR